MVETVPIQPDDRQREINFPRFIDLLLSSHGLRWIEADHPLGAEDFKDDNAVRDTLKVYGLDPEDERTQAVLQGVAILSNPYGRGERALEALNEVIFCRETGFYDDKDLVKVATKRLHARNPYGKKGEFAEADVDCIGADALEADIEDGKALVATADYLIEYARTAQVYSAAMNA